ncbi:PREDICTED: uncharacterized protein LOC106812008, partial [Priapulus caudatus]|uniref:Uncharacterized protein LOC106812008 n=1 Tax=Priapulus caudatus TaxID=37621 RepID=A0ABM1EGC5_PRICU
MACTALKRPVDFEHIHSPLQRSPKRRRCMPMVISNGSTQTKSTQPQPNPSHFGEVRPKYTPELIQDRLQAEVRRMRKRRQVIYDANRRGLLQSSSPPPSDSDSEMPSVGSPQPSTSSHSAMTTSGTQCRKELKEQPLFTLKQVCISDRWRAKSDAWMEESQLERVSKSLVYCCQIWADMDSMSHNNQAALLDLYSGEQWNLNIERIVVDYTYKDGIRMLAASDGSSPWLPYRCEIRCNNGEHWLYPATNMSPYPVPCLINDSDIIGPCRLTH